MALSSGKFAKRQAVGAVHVARLAGVSQSSVSRVFLGGKVAIKRDDRMVEAANSLGYRHDEGARGGHTTIRVRWYFDELKHQPHARHDLCCRFFR